MILHLRLKRQKQPTTSGNTECLTSSLWDFNFMAVMRLHHSGIKRARSQSMPYPEALPQAYLITRENAPWGARSAGN
jgi:hypothetical protein